MSQLVKRGPVIEVAVAGLLPALLRVALQRYRDPATRAQTPFPFASSGQGSLARAQEAGATFTRLFHLAQR
jgi:hypothetical protein